MPKKFFLKNPAGHGNSIKAPRVYEALRRKGMSKTKAARISNGLARSGAKIKVRNRGRRKR